VFVLGRRYANNVRTHLQPESSGHACDAQSDAGCCGIHDEIAEPCMTIVKKIASCSMLCEAFTVSEGYSMN
jgi:hypothetical protein